MKNKAQQSWMIVKPLALAVHVSIITGSGLISTMVFADNHTAQNYQIKAGSLSEALIEFSLKTGVTLTVDYKKLEGLKSAGLSGQYNIDSGFAKLLEHTPYIIQKNGAAYILVEKNKAQPQVRDMGRLNLIDVNTIESVQRDNNAMQLPAITIHAEDKTNYAAKTATIGKTQQTLKEIPQSVSVITQQQMEDQGFTTIASALNQATGVVSYGYANSENYQIRFAAANVQVNGVPQADNISNEDPALYESIEVLRGPSGLLTGSGDPSGSINFVRKRPMLENTGSIALSAGSWGSYRSEFDANAKLTDDGRFRGRLVGAYNNQGEFYDNATDNTRTTIYGVVEYDLTEQATLGLSATHIEQDHTLYWGLPLNSQGQVPDKKYYVGYRRPSHNEQNQYTIDLKYNLENNWIAKVAYNYSEQEFTNFGAYAVAPLDNSNLTNVNVGYIEQDYTYKNFDLNLSGPIALFGREHQLLFGYNQWQSEYLGGAKYERASNWDALNNHNYDSIINKNLTKSLTLTKQSGFYTSAKIKLIDPLTLIVGGRWSDYSERGGAKVNNEFTPYTGLVWDINEQFTWYASYADSFVPQTEKNFQQKTLDPRIGWQIETGLKAEFFDGALNSSAAIFQIRDKNRAMEDLEHVGCETATGTCSKAAGEVQARGFELEITGKPTENWNISAGYTYNDLKYLSDDNPKNIGTRFSADIIPKQLFKLWSVYSFDEKVFSGIMNHWNMGVGVQTQSSLYNQNMNRPSYSIFSAKLGYQINDNWQASLQVNNLFDKTYLNNPGSTFFYNIYGEPRSYMFSLRAKY